MAFVAFVKESCSVSQASSRYFLIRSDASRVLECLPKDLNISLCLGISSNQPVKVVVCRVDWSGNPLGFLYYRILLVFWTLLCTSFSGGLVILNALTLYSFIDPLQLNISIHILHTDPFSFLMTMIRRICLTIRSVLNR